VVPAKRVAIRRTRIQPVPAGAVRSSETSCHASGLTISPESNESRTTAFARSRYSTTIRAVSGGLSWKVRTLPVNAKR